MSALKLNSDDLLSNFAFKFNMRRYSLVQINTSGGGLKFFSAPACDTLDPTDPLVRDADWATWQGPPAVAGHVIGYRIPQEMRAHNACR
jgi:hypothetical protein